MRGLDFESSKLISKSKYDHSSLNDSSKPSAREDSGRVEVITRWEENFGNTVQFPAPRRRVHCWPTLQCKINDRHMAHLRRWLSYQFPLWFLVQAPGVGFLLAHGRRELGAFRRWKLRFQKLQKPHDFKSTASYTYLHPFLWFQEYDSSLPREWETPLSGS